MYDVTKPEVIRYLTESYEKETRMRQKWNLLHKENILKAAAFTRKEKGYTADDITKYLCVTGMVSLSKDHAVNSSTKHTAPIKDYLLCKTRDGNEYRPTMKPIKNEVRKLIPENRKKYLKVRNDLAPEDKYYYLESENWKYGWMAKESGIKLSGPHNGFIYHMLHLAHNRVGPQRDPDYYNCEEISVL